MTTPLFTTKEHYTDVATAINNEMPNAMSNLLNKYGATHNTREIEYIALGAVMEASSCYRINREVTERKAK